MCDEDGGGDDDRHDDWTCGFAVTVAPPQLQRTTTADALSLDAVVRARKRSIAEINAAPSPSPPPACSPLAPAAVSLQSAPPTAMAPAVRSAARSSSAPSTAAQKFQSVHQRRDHTADSHLLQLLAGKCAADPLHPASPPAAPPAPLPSAPPASSLPSTVTQVLVDEEKEYSQYTAPTKHFSLNGKLSINAPASFVRSFVATQNLTRVFNPDLQKWMFDLTGDHYSCINTPGKGDCFFWALLLGLFQGFNAAATDLGFELAHHATNVGTDGPVDGV